MMMMTMMTTMMMMAEDLTFCIQLFVCLMMTSVMYLMMQGEI